MWAAAKHTTSGSDSLFGPAKTALARGDHMVVDQHQPRCQRVSRSFITVDHQYQAALAPEPAVIGAARRHIGPLPASSGTQPGATWRQELREGNMAAAAAELAWRRPEPHARPDHQHADRA
jgi:hypothetical protein